MAPMPGVGLATGILTPASLKSKSIAEISRMFRILSKNPRQMERATGVSLEYSGSSVDYKMNWASAESIAEAGNTVAQADHIVMPGGGHG